MAKVLLIDDDVDLVEQNQLVLKAKGHTVLTAYSGKEAREVLKKETPDIIVVDVMMEEQTAGFELAREVNAKHPKLPLLMLSGIRDALNYKFKYKPDESWLPVSKFIDKPITPDKLAAEVAAQLAKHGKK